MLGTGDRGQWEGLELLSGLAFLTGVCSKLPPIALLPCRFRLRSLLSELNRTRAYERFGLGAFGCVEVSRCNSLWSVRNSCPPLRVLLSEGAPGGQGHAERANVGQRMAYCLRSAMAGGEFRCKGAVIAALRERAVLVKVRHKAKASGRVGAVL